MCVIIFRSMKWESDEITPKTDLSYEIISNANVAVHSCTLDSKVMNDWHVTTQELVASVTLSFGNNHVHSAFLLQSLHSAFNTFKQTKGHWKWSQAWIISHNIGREVKVSSDILVDETRCGAVTPPTNKAREHDIDVSIPSTTNKISS